MIEGTRQHSGFIRAPDVQGIGWFAAAEALRELGKPSEVAGQGDPDEQCGDNAERDLRCGDQDATAQRGRDGLLHDLQSEPESHLAERLADENHVVSNLENARRNRLAAVLQPFRLRRIADRDDGIAAVVLDHDIDDLGVFQDVFGVFSQRRIVDREEIPASRGGELLQYHMRRSIEPFQMGLAHLAGITPDHDGQHHGLDRHHADDYSIAERK